MCLYNNFSFPGKVFNWPNLKQFRKASNKSIQFWGKSFEMLEQLWKFTPKVTGGFCWYIEWENISQMDSMCTNLIARDVITISERLQLKILNWEN